MAKPTLTSKTDTESKLIQYATNVVKKTKENVTLFPDATVKLTTLEAALTNYTDSKIEASFRDMRQVAIKNKQADILKTALYDLSLHIESIAKGDKTIILASGFIPNKDLRNSIGQSPKANDLRAVVVNPGTNAVEVRVNPWKPARFYQFEFRKADSMNNWESILSSKSRLTISGLEYREEYEFRVTYLSTNPTPNYSDTVRCVIG